MKRRHLQSCSPLVHDASVSFSDNEESQLSEDDLFRLLMGRIKQREKKELNAATLHEKMEAKTLGLEDENKALKDSLESANSQLQKKVSETKNCMSQIDRWKAKLSKFKHFLNEFGKDYQTLRDEADSLKTDRSALVKEKRYMSDTIDDLRKSISGMSKANCDIEKFRGEVENISKLYKEDLKSSDKATALANKQLADERRRVALLELFIQQQSRSQGRQLTSIQDSQNEIVNKIQSSSNSVEQTCGSSQGMIQAMMDRIMHEILSSINNLKVECTTEKLDTQQVTDKFSMLSSR